MRQDNKIIVSAVLILGLSLLSFNFGGVSGQASYANVECSPIDVRVVGSSSSKIDLSVYIPPEKYAGVSYNGFGDNNEVIVRDEFGSKRADVRIPKSVLNTEAGETARFSISKPRNLERGFACIENKCPRQKDSCDSFP